MNILIRADSGFHIGLGHVMRCLTLAHGFIERGHSVFFVTRKHKNYYVIPETNNLHVTYLENGVQSLGKEDRNSYSKWSGVSYEVDAAETNRVCDRPELVIIDHYSFDYRYEKLIRAKKIVVIDDLMNRRHDCKILIDQNLSADLSRYAQLCSSKTEFLLGPKYALLRPEFSSLRPVSAKLIKDIKDILVFFGGSDISNQCKKVADAYLKVTNTYRLHIVLSEKHKDFKDLSTRKDVIIYPFVKNIAELYSKVDICFGASGSSSWERATLGVPSILTEVAENQAEIIQALSNRGACWTMSNDGNIKSWGEAFEKLDDIDGVNQLSRESFCICDGVGAERVIERIVR